MPWTMEQIFSVKTNYETKFLIESAKFLPLEAIKDNIDQSNRRSIAALNSATTKKFKGSHRRNIHALSTTLYASFSNSFNWTADVGCMYSWFFS